MRKIVSMSLGVLLGCATFLHAEDGVRSEFSVNPGIAIPAGSTGDYHKNSFSLDLSYLKRIHSIAAVGWELGYMFGSKLDGKIPERELGDVDGDGVADSVNITSDVSSKVLHLTPEIKLGPVLDVQNFKVNPYLVGGGGFYWTHTPSGDVTLSGRTSGGTTLSSIRGSLDSNDDYNGGWNFGGGASLALPQNWSVGFEVRYHRIVYKHGDDAKFVIPALRFSLQFD